MRRVSLIVPTYNEARNLPLFVEEVMHTVNTTTVDLEIIVVDDNSPDGTGAVAEELVKQYPVRVIHRSGKLGLGSAVREGFVASDREIVGVMDADLSHDPVIINQLLEALTDNDIAIGSRFQETSEVENWKWWRKLLSNVGVLLARLLTGVRDPLSGYFFLKRSVIEGVPLTTTGYKILFEILVKGRYSTIVELPYRFRMRKYSTSKLNMREYFLFMVQIVSYAWYTIHKNRKWFLLLLALAFGGVLANSVHQSIWLDEGLSIQFAQGRVSELLNIVMTSDLHPPLYNLFLHFSGILFGTEIWQYRLWSGLFYAAASMVLWSYLCSHHVFAERGRWKYALAGMFLLSPFAVYYASEARSYMLVILVALVQFVAFDNVFGQPQPARRQVITYTVSSIIGVYLFYPFLFSLVAQFVYVLAFKRSYFKTFLVPWVVIAVAYAPWIALVIVRRLTEAPGHFLAIPWWQIPAIILAGFSGGRVAITDLNHIRAYWPTVLATTAHLAVLAGLAWWWKRKEQFDFLKRLLTVALVPIIICLFISYFRFPVFDPRYYAQIFPLFIIMVVVCGAQLLRSVPRYGKAAIALLLLADLVIIGLYSFHPLYQREQWKTVVRQLEAELQLTDAVVFIGIRQPPPTYAAYQTKETEIISTYQRFPEDLSDYPAVEKHLKTALADNQRVWYSQFLEWQKDPEKKIRATIEKEFVYRKTIGIFKVQFDLYERR